MNRKLIALLIVVVVLGTLFAGCTMFELDKNRDYHQVVATVDYHGMTAEIYKGDVLTLVLAYGGQYIQNYGMTPEQVVEYFYNNASKQKLLLLFAKEYVANKGVGGIDIVTGQDAVANMKTKEFLTVDEYRYCIEMTNKQFNKLWQDKISALDKEAEANKGTEEDKKDPVEEDEKEKELAARPVRPKKEASEEYENQGVTSEENLPDFFFDIASQKIKDEKGQEKPDKEKINHMSSALNDLKKDLKDNFHDYDYFLNQQMENYIVEKYQKALGNTINVNSEAFTAELNKRYKKLLDTDIAQFVDEDAYKTAIEGGQFALYHVEKGYSTVKSILLQFNEYQKATLELVKKIYGDDFAKTFRNDMAIGNVVGNDKYPAEIQAMLKDEKVEKDSSKGVTINVSNPNYDEKEQELKDAYTDKNVSLEAVLYSLANDVANKAKKMTDKAKLDNPNITEKQLKAVKDYATKLAFVDWTYLVNDDPGMFQSESYFLTRDGKDSQYVEEFTILGRELAKEGVGSIAVSNEGITPITKNVAYAGTTEILKDSNGKTVSIYKKEAVSHLDKNKEIKTDIYTLTTDLGNSISYIINDFGIHLIMSVGTPFNEKATEAEGLIKTENGYKLGLNYVYEEEVTVKYVKDEEGKDTEEIKSIEVKTKTIKDYVSDKMKKEKESDLSTTKQVELFSNDDYITKNEKVYKQILKELIGD